MENNKIQFRVWWAKMNRYCCGAPFSLTDIYKDSTGSYVTDGHTTEPDFCCISDPENTVEQWVGIKDTNGALIYEGDIVENSTSYEEYCSPAVVSRSVYEDISYSLYRKLQKIESYHVHLEKKFNNVALYEEFPLMHRGSYTVIGNIHQNIDLFNNV
jgi:uncharacterized phage protein (TIGR01671 family)